MKKATKRRPASSRSAEATQPTSEGNVMGRRLAFAIWPTALLALLAAWTWQKQQAGDVPVLQWAPDKPLAAFLGARTRPVVLRNSLVTSWPALARWDFAYLAKSSRKSLQGLFHHTGPVFGPFYDEKRPLHGRHRIRRPDASYETNATLPLARLAVTFAPGNEPSEYWAFSGSLRDIDKALEKEVDLRELLSLYPQHSSVNLWLSMEGGVTPCHFDGFHNMYVQIAGVKRFLLLPPDSHASREFYPFLHPSYAQCRNRLADSPSGHVMEVTLQPGDLLYLPPFWLHEAVGLSPSISLNVWTGINDSQRMERILGMQIPGFRGGSPSATSPAGALSPETLSVSMAARFQLGSLLVLDVAKKLYNSTALVVSLFHSRFQFLKDSEALPPCPRHLCSSVAAWLRRNEAAPPALAAAGGAYAQRVAEELQAMQTENSIWFFNFIEAVALQAAGAPEHAGWMVECLAL
ncbi:unnamed protein product [Effrenium voratum]|uniref:JmjC domain-containing protein n=1 Tax=Effrenium voratum TaxID=2562239 RepID=A0AA36MVM8_9DINO|nr:unnamed protein product [Effrenium voratum]CAJ1424214.1 unnamed protein product [Effrenium voratum]